jgi:putative membrane protein
MKASKVILGVMALGLIGLVVTSCGDKKSNENTAGNDKEMADEVNDEKFETKESEKDADFLVKAVAANMAEIKLAQLGTEKSGNAEIKALGRQLEKDHNQILSDLRNLADKRGVTLPNVITEEDSTEIEDLRKEKLVDFDKKWLKELEDRHKSSLKSYKDCAEDARDVELQNLANQHIVTIESHHHMIEKQLEKIK